MSNLTNPKQSLKVYGGLNGVKSGDLFKAVCDTIEGRPILKLEKLPNKDGHLLEAIHSIADAMDTSDAKTRYAHVSQAFRELFATRTAEPSGFNKPKKQASKPHFAETQYTYDDFDHSYAQECPA